MPLKTGFAEVDITPPLGTRKIGWLKELVGTEVLDPLFARAAVVDAGEAKVGFIQLDTLSIRWTQVNEIRRRISSQYGFPGENVMVAATHNHAGPAVATTGDVPRDEEYIEAMVAKIVTVFGQAIESREEASIGFASGPEFNVGYNRRVTMRDGTVCTHGAFSDPNALCLEGPIDPEVAVMAARNRSGDLLGCLINFTCHPTHNGPGEGFSAGYPGVLAREMKARGCPVTLFLNGAAGNISTSNPCLPGSNHEMEEVGATLAHDAAGLIERMEWKESVMLLSRSATVELPFRTVTESEIKGTVRGAQRFVDPAIYDRGMPSLVEKIAHRGTQVAEVQALFLDEYAYVSIPAEYFVELGLRIKEETSPHHTLVVGYANGMVGYVPTRDAFRRGGYETTFAHSSKLAPEAGDMLADCAIALVASSP